MAVDDQSSSSHATPAAGRATADSPHWPEAGDPRDVLAKSDPRIAEDDFEDTPSELQRCYPQESTAELQTWLEAVRQPLADHGGTRSSLLALYRAWDGEAQLKQQHYLWLVRSSGIFAVLAVMLAIIQLPQVEWEQYGIAEWPPLRWLMDLLHIPDIHALFEVGEVLSAVLALFAVLFGIWSAYSHQWQLRRLQAEQCRFLKFGYLLRCASSVEEARRFLADGLQRLIRLDAETEPHKIAKRWIRRELELIPMPRALPGKLTLDGAAQLVEYFLRKRIRYQAAYFKRQAHRREFKEKLLWWLPVSLFFLSLIFAIAHAVLPAIQRAFATPPHAAAAPSDAGQPRKESLSAAPTSEEHDAAHHNTLALVCLLGAAGLPAMAAWVRTYRGALEFARNANRFQGMWIQLHDFEAELQQRKQQGDLLGQFEILRDVEIALEAEHRSWIRLMVEAEWFG